MTVAGPGSDEPPRAQRFERPEMSVLGDDALVPDASLVRPAPTEFTHRLRRTTPFSYVAGGSDTGDDGELAKGAEVVLLSRSGKDCRVVRDGRRLALPGPAGRALPHNRMLQDGVLQQSVTQPAGRAPPAGSC